MILHMLIKINLQNSNKIISWDRLYYYSQCHFHKNSLFDKRDLPSSLSIQTAYSDHLLFRFGLIIHWSHITVCFRFSSGSRAWLVVEAVLLILSIAFNCLLICLRIKRNTAKDMGLKKAFIRILQGKYIIVCVKTMPILNWCKHEKNPLILSRFK